MVYTQRWRGRSADDVSTAMKALVARKNKKMTKAQRVEHALKMVAARGQWKMVDGERVFVRKVK